jgi:hypothetical protein
VRREKGFSASLVGAAPPGRRRPLSPDSLLSGVLVEVRKISSCEMLVTGEGEKLSSRGRRGNLSKPLP